MNYTTKSNLIFLTKSDPPTRGGSDVNMEELKSRCCYTSASVGVVFRDLSGGRASSASLKASRSLRCAHSSDEMQGFSARLRADNEDIRHAGCGVIWPFGTYNRSPFPSSWFLWTSRKATSGAVVPLPTVNSEN